jgi:hypothetical protein
VLFLAYEQDFGSPNILHKHIVRLVLAADKVAEAPSWPLASTYDEVKVRGELLSHSHGAKHHRLQFGYLTTLCVKRLPVRRTLSR